MQPHAVAPTVAPTLCICICVYICICICVCICVCICIWIPQKLQPSDKLPHVHLLARVDDKKLQKPNPWILELCQTDSRITVPVGQPVFGLEKIFKAENQFFKVKSNSYLSTKVLK